MSKPKQRGLSEEEAKALTNKRREEFQAKIRNFLAAEASNPPPDKEHVNRAIENAVERIVVLSAKEVRRQLREDFSFAWVRREEVTSAIREYQEGAPTRNPQNAPIDSSTGLILRFPVRADYRVHVSRSAEETMLALREKQPEVIVDFAMHLLVSGPLAVLDATADLLEHTSPEDLQTNVLSALGNLLSKALRRRVLLAALEQHQWHLRNVALALRMGQDATTVVRAIRDLDLTEEYEKAKERLGILPGGHRAVGGAQKK